LAWRRAFPVWLGLCALSLVCQALLNFCKFYNICKLSELKWRWQMESIVILILFLFLFLKITVLYSKKWK
jgi:hypothetical protein